MGEIVSRVESLSKHPIEEHIVLDEEVVKNSAVAIGDLHGNAMKGIHFLISSGVMRLGNQAQYGDLWKIYNKSTEQLTTEDISRFKEILNQATITQPRLITFIGDELADRGQNDYFTLLMMKKLHDSQVPYQIQLSNHSSVALQSFSTEKPVVLMSGKQQQSIDALWKLVSRKIITNEDVSLLANSVYKPHLSLIGYTKTADDKLTIYTHAPVGLETIRDLARKFDVNYNDSSMENLMQCIDNINTKASNAILNDTFIELHNVTKDTSNMNDPLARLFWARTLEKNVTFTPKGPFTVECVHGHIGPFEPQKARDFDKQMMAFSESDRTRLLSALHNTDSHFGMGFKGDNEKDCPVFHEEKTLVFVSSYRPPKTRLAEALADLTDNPTLNVSSPLKKAVLLTSEELNIVTIISELIYICQNYEEHLQQTTNSLNTEGKKQIIAQALRCLENIESRPQEKLTAFDNILTNEENVKILTTRRDDACTTFFKAINLDDIWLMDNKELSDYVNGLILKTIESSKTSQKGGGDEAASALSNLLKEEYSISNFSFSDLKKIKEEISKLESLDLEGINGPSQYNIAMWHGTFNVVVTEAMMVMELRDIVNAHKDTLEKLSPSRDQSYVTIKQDNEIWDEHSDIKKLSIEKLSTVNRFIKILDSDISDEKKIADFKKEYADSKGTFTQGNDSVGKLFVNSISCVFSQGIKAAYSMWKEGVKAIERTKQIDELVSNEPKNKM